MALPFPARPTQLDENWFPEREVWDVAVETRIGVLEDVTGVPGIAFDYVNSLFALSADGLAFAQATEPVDSYGAWAGGDGSAIAIGTYGTVASGYSSLAIGDGATADEQDTISIGSYAEAHAAYSVVIGSGAESMLRPDESYTKHGMIIIGEDAEGFGRAAIAIGSNASAVAEDSIVIGPYSEVYTPRAIAIGSDTFMVGGSVGIGYKASGRSVAAIGIGYQAIAHAPFSTVIGYSENYTYNTIRERAMHMARDIEVKRPAMYSSEPEPTYSITDFSTGVILHAPDDTRWRLTVSSAGVVAAEAIGAYDSLGWTKYSLGSFAGSALAGSDDMATLVAGGTSSTIRTSADSGATWTARTGPGTSTWQDFAVSADGTKMVAAGYTGKNLWTSANSGVSWTERTAPGVGPWSSVAMSANGLIIYATSIFVNDKFWKSTDGGATWTKKSNAAGLPAFIGAVACSSDGLSVVVTARDPLTFMPTLWYSGDGGTTWALVTIYWEDGEHGTVFDGVAMTGDGSAIVAWGTQGRSHFQGDSDSVGEYADGLAISRVKLARDGDWGLAISEDSQILWSDDEGAYWTYVNGSGRDTGVAGWRDIAIGADGTKVAALDISQYIYTKTYTL